MAALSTHLCASAHSAVNESEKSISIPATSAPHNGTASGSVRLGFQVMPPPGEADGSESATSSAGSPLPSISQQRRTTIQWRSLGFFNSETKMGAIRNSRKVSKRKTDFLRNGKKVTYRCNNWKRSRCPFQMYALYSKDADGLTELFETCAEHNHTIRGKRTAEEEIEIIPKEDSPPLTTLSEENNEEGDDVEELRCETNFETRQGARLDKTDDSPPPGETFQLMEKGGCLIELARDHNLALSFNGFGSGEFTFTRAGAPNDARVVIREDEESVHVIVIHDSEFVVLAQKWTKCVWSMLEAAIRGICLEYLQA